MPVNKVNIVIRLYMYHNKIDSPVDQCKKKEEIENPVRKPMNRVGYYLKFFQPIRVEETFV